jgi:hypothetical protein
MSDGKGTATSDRHGTVPFEYTEDGEIYSREEFAKSLKEVITRKIKEITPPKNSISN